MRGTFRTAAAFCLGASALTATPILVAGPLVLLSSSTALADCVLTSGSGSGNTPNPNSSVSCSGTTSQTGGVVIGQGPANNINVTLQPNAVVASSAAPPITLGNSAVVVVGSSATLSGASFSGQQALTTGIGANVTISGTTNGIVDLGSGSTVTVRDTAENFFSQPAIRMDGDNNRLTLIPGYGIVGGVIGGNSGATQTLLELSGTGNATFDVSTIGPSAQYQNFAQFQETGTGTWTLLNTTGQITPWLITSGTLSIADDASLGAPSGPLTLSGGTLKLTANTAGSRPVTLGSPGGTMDVALGATLTESGVISGVGSLTKVGSGTLILTGANTYTGGTIVNSGTLQLGPGGGLASSGSLTVNGGTFDLNGHNQTIGNILPALPFGVIQVNGGTLTINQTSGAAFTGSLNGSGALVLNGPSALSFVGANSFTGSITVNAGSLGFQTIGGGNDLAINGGTFSLQSKTMDFGALSGTGGTLSMGGSFLSFNSNTNSLFAGVISDGGPSQFTKLGTGTLTLTGSAVESGSLQVVISAGTLQFGNGGTSGGFALSNITDNAKLIFNRSNSVAYYGTITGSGSVSLSGAGTVSLLSLNNNYTGGTTIASGVLDARSLSGDVVDNGTLLLNVTNPFSGVISGSGSLQRTIGGTLILTANSTYTGGATINSGASVQLGNGGTIGSIQGNVADNGALIFNRSDAFSFSGIISGTGSLTKTGSGTLVLTGANTYAGGTTISGGTLQLGTPATAGSITGDVVNNGQFQFDRSDAYVFAGNISGSGIVWVAGQGTAILTGSSSYTGDTTVFINSTLQAGSGGSSGSLANGLIHVGGGTVVFNRLDSYVFSGVITDSIDGTGLKGNVKQGGTGTTVLAGVNTYSGITSVASGTLTITGSIANSSVSVANGATLTGTGKVGATTVASGGILNPGSGTAPGTLSVAGNLSLASGSNYLDVVTPLAAGLASVSGTANVNGNVAVSVASGAYSFGQRFTILTATSGVIGSFAGLNGVPGYLKGQLSYDTNNAYLTLSPNALAPLISNTSGNQNSVVGTIDKAVAAGNVPPGGFVALYALSGPALNNAIDQISGQAAPNVVNAVGQASLSFMTMTASGGGGETGSFAPGSAYGGADAPHRAQLGAGQMRVWGAAYGGHAGLSGDSSSGAANLSSDNVGMIGGADMQVTDGIRTGLTLGLGRQLFHSGNGSGESNDFLFGLYGRADAGAAYVAASLGFGWHQIKTLRVVTVSGTDVLQGKENAHDVGGRIEAGWRLPLEDGYTVIPFGAFAGDSFENPAYAETAVSGANSFALSYAAQTTTLGRSELGARLDRDYMLEQGVLTADVRAGWAHQLDDLPLIQASFQNLPGTSFQVAGVRPARDSGLLGLDLGIHNASGLFFGVRGEGQFGAGTTLVEGMGNFGWRW